MLAYRMKKILQDMTAGSNSGNNSNGASNPHSAALGGAASTVAKIRIFLAAAILLRVLLYLLGPAASASSSAVATSALVQDNAYAVASVSSSSALASSTSTSRLLDDTSGGNDESVAAAAPLPTVAAVSVPPANGTRTCLSPERHVEWPLGGCKTPMGRSHSTDRTCALCNQSPFAHHLEQLARSLEHLKRQECERLVVFSVAFGLDYLKWYAEGTIKDEVAKEVIDIHGRCFVTFVLDTTSTATSFKFRYAVSKDRVDTVVAVHSSALPYVNPRRNTKLFKLSGHLLFPWAERVIYHASKMRVDYDWFSYSFSYFKYFEETVEKPGVCASYVGMPLEGSAMGRPLDPNLKSVRLSYQCDAVVNALERRPTVTDSGDALSNQCRTYMSEVNKNSTILKLTKVRPLRAPKLDSKLIDGALIAWSLMSERCKQYAADSGCTWLDEVHCHSDRDQISFPYSAEKMKLRQLTGKSAERTHRIFGHPDTEEKLIFLSAGNCHFLMGDFHKCDFSSSNNLPLGRKKHF